jgi:hypothetical protein
MTAVSLPDMREEKKTKRDGFDESGISELLNKKTKKNTHTHTHGTQTLLGKIFFFSLLIQSNH